MDIAVRGDLGDGLDMGCLTGRGVKGWNKDRTVQATDVLMDGRAVRDRVTTIDTD